MKKGGIVIYPVNLHNGSVYELEVLNIWGFSFIHAFLVIILQLLFHVRYTNMSFFDPSAIFVIRLKASNP